MNTVEHDIVFKTCQLLVSHFRNLVELDTCGFNSRIFEHMLHPENRFVFAGTSISVNSETKTHPEHVVPCAFMIEECKRLIRERLHTDFEIAALLQRHWKVATITKIEQANLDYELGLKSKMPPGWKFEDGDTYARLKLAGVTLVNQE